MRLNFFSEVVLGHKIWWYSAKRLSRGKIVGRQKLVRHKVTSEWSAVSFTCGSEGLTRCILRYKNSKWNSPVCLFRHLSSIIVYFKATLISILQVQCQADFFHFSSFLSNFYYDINIFLQGLMVYRIQRSIAASWNQGVCTAKSVILFSLYTMLLNDGVCMI